MASSVREPADLVQARRRTQHLVEFLLGNTPFSIRWLQDGDNQIAVMRAGYQLSATQKEKLRRNGFRFRTCELAGLRARGWCRGAESGK